MNDKATEFLAEYKDFADAVIAEGMKEEHGMQMKDKWGVDWQPIWEALSGDEKNNFLNDYHKITLSITAAM